MRLDTICPGWVVYQSYTNTKQATWKRHRKLASMGPTSFNVGDSWDATSHTRSIPASMGPMLPSGIRRFGLQFVR